MKGLSENLLSNRDSKYLLLSGIHYQTFISSLASVAYPYHSSEASCLLYHACRHAHPIATISSTSLVIIMLIQIQIFIFADY